MNTQAPGGMEELPFGHDWPGLVDRIQRGDPSAMEELYRVFFKGIRFYLCRQLGPQELDDRIHDIFITIVQAIKRGDLREPERLMGFVRTVVKRQVAAQIEEVVATRRDQVELESGALVPDASTGPEERVISEEKSGIMRRLLNSLPGRDREVLTRFYLHEQSQEEICAEMQLSETQFRLLKSRAKARFGEMGRKQLSRHSFAAYFLRKTSRRSH